MCYNGTTYTRKGKNNMADDLNLQKNIENHLDLLPAYIKEWYRTKMIAGRSVFPADAGVIPFKMVWIHSFTCFSRTCGGDPGAVSILVILAGFFPHMRGWSWFIEHKNEPNAVFPAYAGVIPIQRIKTIAFYCFSRIRGGYPEITCHLSFKFSFFPHTRGWSWSRLGA